MYIEQKYTSPLRAAPWCTSTPSVAAALGDPSCGPVGGRQKGKARPVAAEMEALKWPFSTAHVGSHAPPSHQLHIGGAGGGAVPRGDGSAALFLSHVNIPGGSRAAASSV